MKEVPLSQNERDFLEQSLAAGARLDGRGQYDFRGIELHFGKDRGHLEVSLGETKVLAQTSCEVVEPPAHRPTEGLIRYSVELSPMAAPSFEVGRQPLQGVEIQRIVERALKESRAVETESLCIVAGEKVWAVRVDITVLDHGGNLVDAVALAALGSLLHFRKPHVDVIGSEVTIHTLQSHVPDPLSVHHRPLCVSFGLFGAAGEAAVVDPGLKEEAVAVGTLTLALNVHREVCAIHKLGGATLSADQLLECMEIAHVKAGELAAQLEDALKADEAARSNEVARPPSLLELSKQRITAAARSTAEVEMVPGYDDGHHAAAATAAADAAVPMALADGAAELFAGGSANSGSGWN